MLACLRLLAYYGSMLACLLAFAYLLEFHVCLLAVLLGLFGLMRLEHPASCGWNPVRGHALSCASERIEACDNIEASHSVPAR